MERLLQKFVSAVLWSVALAILLLGIQLLLQNFVRILGQDMSSLNGGVLKYYPSIAVIETIKIVGAIAIAFSPGVWTMQNAWRRQIISRKKTRFYLVFFALGSGYWLAFFGSFLKFPALYENYVPELINQIVFRLSSVVSPTALNAAAAFSLVLAWLISLERKKNNRKMLALASVGILALGFLASSVNSNLGRFTHDSKRPNILFIGVDSLRYDKVQDADLMPRVGELLKSPATAFFRDHHVGIPRTFPSWVEILGGNYGAHTGFRHMFPGLLQLRKQVPTLPLILNNIGYTTSVISDFAGDVFPRFNTGFQTVDTPAMNLKTMIQVNVDMMFPLFFPLILTHLGRTLFPALDESPAFADPNWLGARAIGNLQQTQDKPFFMTVFFSTAHFPYATPWPYYSARSSKEYQGPFKFQKNPDINGKGSEISEADIQQVRNLYDGALSAIDESIGKILDELTARNLLKDTMIIITADHGEDLFDSGKIHGHGDHLIGDKVLHVPWILKFPEEVTVNRHDVNSLSRSIDISPTILDFLGQDHSMMEGISHLPAVLHGVEQETPGGAYSETGIWFSNKGNSHFQKTRIDYPSISQLLSFDPGGTKEVVLNEKYENVIGSAKHRSLILGDYKIIYMPMAEKIVYKLFNRRKDPDNLNDLTDTEPLIFASMKLKLMDKLKQLEGSEQLVHNYVVPK